MKEIFYSLVLCLVVLTSCGEDFDDPNLGTKTVYKGDSIAIAIAGINNSLLENPSAVTTEYSTGNGTIVLNNIVYPKSSPSALKYQATFVKDSTFFTINEDNKNYIAKLEGVIVNKELTLEGKITYKLAGIARSYSEKRLNIDGVNPAAEEVSASLALIKDANGKEKTNEIEITLSGYVKENGKAVNVKIIADVAVDSNNVFTITNGTGSTDITDVTLAGTYSNQILSINVTATPKP